MGTCKDRFRRGVIQDKQAKRRRTKKNKLEAYFMRAVVKGGVRREERKKSVDIRQSEARSSKQRLKGGNRYREKGGASIVTEEWLTYPEKSTAWTCDCELTSWTEKCIQYVVQGRQPLTAVGIHPGLFLHHVTIVRVRWAAQVGRNHS